MVRAARTSRLGVGVPDARTQPGAFWVGDTARSSSSEYREPAPATRTRPVTNNHLGAAHVCFKVDGRLGDEGRARGAGVTFYADVNVVDSGPLAGWRWVYFSDPDGLALELVAGRLLPGGRAQEGDRRVPGHRAPWLES